MQIMKKNSVLNISTLSIQPGERLTIALPTPEIYTCAPFYIPAHIIHGKKAGPTLFISGALHGDEINGVAMTQQLLQSSLLKSIKGTLIVVPTLNIYGLMTLSRNLPDRRDLEGSFPGTLTGSFASRLAHFLTEEIFSLCTHCIDIHTGEPHISKFPQVKTNLENIEANQLARAFEAPVMVNTQESTGLLWLNNHKEFSVPTIIYEVGEALRLNQPGIKTGIKGIIRVMRNIGMLATTTKERKPTNSLLLDDERWLRAGSSGLSKLFCKEGQFIKKGMTLAKISDPFGTEQKEELIAPCDGIVIAKNKLPILNEGEPIVQIAAMKESQVEKMHTWSDAENEIPLE